MSKSIAKNFGYNLVYQIITLLMPLITVPYVSRVLGKEGIGIYSYTSSIVQYFTILGTLGIPMYGNRQIAYVRDDKEKMSKTFWSIVSLNIITTSIALVCYIIIFEFNLEYGIIYIIQSINIVSAMINITWLYIGLEDFKKTVIRNSLVKVIGIISIFMFVKSSSDLYKYVIINVLIEFIGNLVMWGYIPKIVLMVKLSLKDIKDHIFPTLKLFIPQIAIQVYWILDKTMLGNLASIGEVGLYEQSQKIIRVVVGLVTSLGIVMLPRMSNIFVNGEKDKINLYLNNSLKGVAYVSIPMAIGLASVSNEFVPWFFGNDFEAVSYLMIILTPSLFFISIGSVLGTQYLLPTDRTKEYTTSVTMGAIINVCLNYILIPTYKAIGACIATGFAEFSVVLIQFLCLRKNIKKRNLAKSLIKYMAASIIMFIIVRIIGILMGISIITTVIQILVGIIIYVLSLIILKEEINLTILKTINLEIINMRKK